MQHNGGGSSPHFPAKKYGAQEKLVHMGTSKKIPAVHNFLVRFANTHAGHPIYSLWKPIQFPIFLYVLY